jgi:NADPH2:quinone reductase
MKAILMTATGDPSVLELHDIPKPELPSVHHVRIKLAAASINPLDIKLRTKPIYYPNRLPTILGCDGAGLVDAIGSAVTRLKVGDAVYFYNGGIGDEPGCYAEYTNVHEEYCALKPVNLSLHESAALPLSLITAWEGLIERAGLQAKETILIHAAAGGVGHIAVQLAHHLGARIAATVSDDKKAGLIHGLGAEKIINYRAQDFVSETLDWTDQQGADIIFDSVGGQTFLRSFNATRIGGKVVSLLSTPLELVDAQLARLRNLSLCHELMLTPQLIHSHNERVRQRKILEQGSKLIEAGRLGVLVSKVLPLKDASEAHRLIERGGNIGKIILTMDCP